MRRIKDFLLITVAILLILNALLDLGVLKRVPGECLGTLSLLEECKEAMQKMP